VAHVFWTDRAKATLVDMADADQDEIRRQLRFIERWPEMFPKLSCHPRWGEHRKIGIRRRWLVLYRVAVSQTTGEEQVYVTRHRPRPKQLLAGA